MKYKNFFRISVITFCVSLGMMSCSEDGDLGQSADQLSSESTAKELTSEQKQELVSDAMLTLNKVASSEGAANVNEAKRVIARIPIFNYDDDDSDTSSDDSGTSSESTGIDKLKALFSNIFNFTDSTTSVSTYIKLCKIYGEYSYDGSKWSIVSLSDKDALTIHYTKNDTTYTVSAKYSNRISVTGPDLTKTFTVLGHTFTYSSYINMPTTVALSVITAYGETTTETDVTANVQLNVTPTNSKYYFDPSSNTATVTGTVSSGSYSVDYSADIDPGNGLITSENTISLGDNDIDLNATCTFTEYEDETSGKTYKVDVNATVPILDNDNLTGDVIIKATVDDTKTVAKNVLGLYTGLVDDPQAAVDAINSNTSIKCTFDGTIYIDLWTILGVIEVPYDYSCDLATITFKYTEKEHGYGLSPVIDYGAVVEFAMSIIEFLGLEDWIGSFFSV